MESHDGNVIEQIGLRLKRGTILFYYASFLIVAILTAISLHIGDLGDALIGVPMLFILGGAISLDKNSVHVPPEMVVFVIITFLVAFLGSLVGDNSGVITYVADVMAGINLGILGLIAIYIILKSLPGGRDENRWFVSFTSICIALASYAMIRMIQYWIQELFGDGASFTLDFLMEKMG